MHTCVWVGTPPNIHPNNCWQEQGGGGGSLVKSFNSSGYTLLFTICIVLWRNSRCCSLSLPSSGYTREEHCRETQPHFTLHCFSAKLSQFILLHETYKLVEKAEKPSPTLHLLTFSWKGMVYEIGREKEMVFCLGPQWKHTVCPIFPGCTCKGRPGGGSGPGQALGLTPDSPHSDPLPFFFLWGSLALWALDICQESHSPSEFSESSKWKAGSIEEVPQKHLLC